MGYALFAQRKLELTGLVNGLQLQQTQRSNEQLQLATNTLSLQQQLTSLQTAQSQELADKYEQLANSGTLNTIYTGKTMTAEELKAGFTESSSSNPLSKVTNFMGNMVQMGKNMVGFIKDNPGSLQEAMEVVENTNTDGVIMLDGVSYDTNTEEGRNAYHQKLADDREKIQAEIKALEQKFKQEEDVINRQIYQVSIKENAIEMEVKRLDTKITAIQKQLEATEEAEGAGIDRATPKYTGVG